MDLVERLSTELSLPPVAAQALAGRVLDTVKRRARHDLGDDASERMDQEIPELIGWSAQAAAMVGEPLQGLKERDHGLLGGAVAAGGLVNAAAEAMGLHGDRDLERVLPLLDQLDLNEDTLAKVLPPIASFLETRLPAALAARIQDVVPWLDKPSDVARPGCHVDVASLCARRVCSRGARPTGCFLLAPFTVG